MPFPLSIIIILPRTRCVLQLINRFPPLTLRESWSLHIVDLISDFAVVIARTRENLLRLLPRVGLVGVLWPWNLPVHIIWQAVPCWTRNLIINGEGLSDRSTNNTSSDVLNSQLLFGRVVAWADCSCAAESHFWPT